MDKKRQIEEMAYEIETRLGHLKSTCYITAETLYAAGYRKQSEAAWILHENGSGTCTQCRTTQKNVWDYDRWQNFCGNCGAKMKGE